jgi:hypothetical protein
MNQKGFTSIILVAVIIILVGAVGYFIFGKKSEPIPKQLTPTKTESPTPSTLTPSGFTSQPKPETPVVEKNVTSQPAYLITAYSKNGKNYIDVDYVEWLHGEASIKAQVEDGECTSASKCYDFPNGYKRNRNPKIRTFEVSSSASIEVSGDVASVLNALGQNLSISFEQFEDVVSKLKSSYPYKPPFKEPKTFITIDVKDNIVTKIIEPYQE